MKPETIRRSEQFVWRFMPRVFVVMLFLGGQAWIACLIWVRLHAPGRNNGYVPMAAFLFLNVVITAGLSYYYRSLALILTAVGWLIVFIASLLFALGFGVAPLVWTGAFLHVVLLYLGLRYCRLAGVDCDTFPSPVYRASRRSRS